MLLEEFRIYYPSNFFISFQNFRLSCPNSIFHSVRCSHDLSRRFQSRIVYLIPSFQLFLVSALSVVSTPYQLTYFSISFKIVSSRSFCCRSASFLTLFRSEILADFLSTSISVASSCSLFVAAFLSHFLSSRKI